MGSSIAMLRSVQVIVIRRGRCRGTAEETMVKCCDCGVDLLIKRIDVSWFCAGKGRLFCGLHQTPAEDTIRPNFAR
jgi:hypothetical protein